MKINLHTYLSTPAALSAWPSRYRVLGTWHSVIICVIFSLQDMQKAKCKDSKFLMKTISVLCTRQRLLSNWHESRVPNELAAAPYTMKISFVSKSWWSGIDTLSSKWSPCNPSTFAVLMSETAMYVCSAAVKSISLSSAHTNKIVR